MPRRKNNEVREIPEKEKLLASEIYKKFKDAMVAKASYTERWFTYLNAWNNSLFEKQYLPAYKTNHVSNFIYSSIESMRPVLFDQQIVFILLQLELALLCSPISLKRIGKVMLMVK